MSDEVDDLTFFLSAMQTGIEIHQKRCIEIFMQKKENLEEFINELMNFLATSTDKELRKVAMICVNSLIRDIPEEEALEFKESLHEKLRSLITKSEKDEIKYASLDAIEIMKGSTEAWIELNEFLKQNMSHDDYLTFCAYLNLMADETTIFQPIVDNLEFAFSAAKDLLLSDNYQNKLSIVRFIGLFTSTFQEIHPRLEELYNIILNLAQESRSTEFNYFIDLWKYISYSYSGPSLELPFFNEFSQLALEIASDSEVHPYQRWIVLGLFRGSLEELTFELYTTIMNLSIETAIDFTENLHQESDFMLEYIISAKRYIPYECITSYLKDKIHELSTREGEGPMVVMNQINKIIFINYQSVAMDCFDDHFKMHMDHIVNDSNTLLEYKSGCELISYYPYFLGWSLVDGSAFAFDLIRFLTIDNVDLQFAAFGAMTRLVDITPIPIKGLAMRLLEVGGEIENYFMREYSDLTSAAIEKEFLIEPEDAIEIEEFAVPSLFDEDPYVRICGVSLLQSLLVNSDQDDFVEEMFEAIDYAFHYDDEFIVCYSLERLYFMVKYLPEEVSACAMRNIDLISEVLNDKNEVHRHMNMIATIFVSTFAMTLPNDEFKEHLLATSLAWLKEDDMGHQSAAARSLGAMSTTLSPEQRPVAVNALIEALMTQRNDQLLWQIAEALTELIRNAPPEVAQEILPDATSAALAFIHGDVAYLQNVPALETDIDYDVFWKLATFFVAVSIGHNEAVSEIFAFLVEMYERNDTVWSTVVLNAFCDLVKQGALLPEELQKVKDIALGLLSEETPREKFQAVAQLLSTLLVVSVIEREEIEEKLGVIEEWWNRMEPYKRLMRSTLTHLTVLTWHIAYKFQMAEEIIPLVMATLPHLPADDPTQDALLLEIVLHEVPKLQIEDRETAIEFARMNALNYATYLILPRRVQERRSGTEEVISKMSEQLQMLVDRFLEVHDAIVEFISEKPSRSERLSFLKL